MDFSPKRIGAMVGVGGVAVGGTAGGLISLHSRSNSRHANVGARIGRGAMPLSDTYTAPFKDLTPTGVDNGKSPKKPKAKDTNDTIVKEKNEKPASNKPNAPKAPSNTVENKEQFPKVVPTTTTNITEGSQQTAVVQPVLKRIEPYYANVAPSFKLLSNGDDSSLYIQDSGAPVFDANAKFNLKTSRCVESFFPGARLPQLEEIQSEDLDKSEPDFNQDSLIPNLENGMSEGKAMGCAIMGVQRRSHLFLFKSEVTLKNDRVGFAYWTGIKNAEAGKKRGLINLQIVNYLAIFERNGNTSQWEVKAGYGWGTEKFAELAHINKLIIKFPNGRQEDIVHQSSIDNTTIHNGYAGVWEENQGAPNAVPALTISSTPYHVGANSIWNIYYQDLELDPTNVNGYNMNGEHVQTFFYEPKGGRDRWKWKRLHKNQKVTRVDIVNTIENWYRPFRISSYEHTDWATVDLRSGTWTEMGTYCNSQKKNLTEDEKKISLCHVLTYGK